MSQALSQLRSATNIMATMKPKTKAGKQAKVGKVMHEYKAGTLHSGKGGPVVKDRQQAIAISMSEAGMAKKPKKK